MHSGSLHTLLYLTLAQAPGLFTVGGESHAQIETIAGLHPAHRGWDSNRLDADDVTPERAERLAATLSERLPDALLYRRLATLSREAPIATDLEQLRWQGVPRAAFESFCDLVGLRSMRERPTRWA